MTTSFTMFAALALMAGAAGCSTQLAPLDEATQPDAGLDAAVGMRQGKVVGTGGIGLNLREAQSTTSEILTVMPEGSIVPILAGPDSGWYQVSYLGMTGFGAEQFIVEIEAGAEHGGVLNLLPWTPGVSFQVTQGHNGFSHTGYNLWAWDFGLPVGTPLLATHNGTVRAIRAGRVVGCCSPTCGEDANFVIIARGDGVESLYLHMTDVDVAVGDEVKRGELIGTSGETGYVCGAHLHFQMQSTPTEGNESYRPSVPGVFHDIGEPFDPTAGMTLVSKNGVIALP